VARKKTIKAVGWERTSPPRPEDVAKAATFPQAPFRRYTYTPQLFVGNPFDAIKIAEHSDAVRALPWLASLGLPPPGDDASMKSGFSILCVMPKLETPEKVWEHFSDEVDRLSDVFDEIGSGSVAVTVDAARRRRDIAADFTLQLRMMKLAETQGFIVDVVDERECSILDVYEMARADRFVDPATYDVVFIDADDREAMALARCGARRVVLVGDCKNQPAAVAPTLTALYDVITDEIAQRGRQVSMPWAPPLPQVPAMSADDAAVDEAIARLSS